jgi:hypothetical protein
MPRLLMDVVDKEINEVKASLRAGNNDLTCQPTLAWSTPSECNSARFVLDPEIPLILPNTGKLIQTFTGKWFDILVPVEIALLQFRRC